MIKALIIQFCVWVITQDAIKHHYNPADHFWTKELEDAGCIGVEVREC